MAVPVHEKIEALILALLSKREGKSICPSEVARKLEPRKWRGLMQPVREAAARLAARGELIACQKEKKVDPLSAKGPIRLKKKDD